MPRKDKKETGTFQITVTNRRKHEARLTDNLSVPSLGSIEIPEAEYKKILAENKYVRNAINKRFLTVSKGK